MDIKSILSTIHKDIQEQRSKLIRARLKIEEQQDILKMWEVESMADIADEINEQGKPAFSNETKRQAELERRKKENRDYQAMAHAVREDKLNYDMGVVILQSMLDQQENARALARIEGVV